MHLRKYHAFSLVEVLVALLVLAVGIAAIIRFQGGALENRGFLTQHHEALQLAEDKLDQLRQYEVVNTVAGKTAYADIASGSTTTTKASTTYTLAWSVTESTNPDYKTVQVTVSWTDRRNTPRSIVLATIIGKIDPANSQTIMQALP